MMENLLLSKNADIAYFQNKLWPGRSGITTVNFGSCHFKKNPQEAEKNRSLVKLMGANFFCKIVPEHSDKVEFVKYFNKSNYYNCDAVIFLQKRFCNGGTWPLLLSNTADCPTIVLHAGSKGIALIHSGWKGTQLNIVGKTVETFRSGLSESSLNFFAFVYGGICGKCYEVGEEFKKYFPKRVHRGHLDLRAVIIDQLKEAGINNIITTDACSMHTKHNDQYLFDSNRRDKTPKRNCVFVAF